MYVLRAAVYNPKCQRKTFQAFWKAVLNRLNDLYPENVSQVSRQQIAIYKNIGI